MAWPKGAIRDPKTGRVVKPSGVDGAARQNGGGPSVDPVAAAAAAGTASEPASRPASGRRDSASSGSGRGTASTAAPKAGASLDLSAWAGLMQGAHTLIAMRRNEPHWLLNDADAKTYGAAIANAMRHLPIGATQKALDFTALMICVVNFESPRVYHSTVNARERRRQRSSPATPEPPSATVYQFTQPNSPPPSSKPAATANGSGGDEGFTGDGIDGPIGGH